MNLICFDTNHSLISEPQEKKGPNIEIELPLELEDLYNGKEFQVMQLKTFHWTSKIHAQSHENN
jgi:DnaJ-class molecular chaperone